MVGRHEFDVSHVDAAIDFVIAHAAEDRAQTASYSRVFAAAGLPAPQDLHMGGESQLVSQFMEAFHYRCRDRELPPLDALVVQVLGPRMNLPGTGYFRVNNLVDPLGERGSDAERVEATRFWEDEKLRCREWGVSSRRGRR